MAGGIGRKLYALGVEMRVGGQIPRNTRGGAKVIFAGHEESPGETMVENGVVYKEYFGSASEFQKGEKKKVLLYYGALLQNGLTAAFKNLLSLFRINYMTSTIILCFYKSPYIKKTSYKRNKSY